MRGAAPQKGSVETKARPQGKAFPFTFLVVFGTMRWFRRRPSRFGYRQASYAWKIAPTSPSPSGTARLTEPLLALDRALAAVGITYLFEPLVRRYIREGTLRWLLPESAIKEPGLFFYFPRRASGMPKLRAFIDAARLHWTLE